jgi:predicted dehydrogenase
MAIAGSGGMAGYQVRKFRAVPGCTISACKDHIMAHAESFALQYAIPGYFDSLPPLLASGAADALSCAVVDSRHADICISALRHGLAVFCEKPLGRTLSETCAMADTAEEASVPNYVNFSKRNAPALHALRKLLRQQALGVIHSVDIAYLQGWAANALWGDWRTVPRWKWRLLPDVSTGGVIGDLGSHVVDALLFLFGELQIDETVVSLNLADAAGAGKLPWKAIGDEFFADPGPVWVDISARGELPDSIPVNLRLSLIEPYSVDDFTISVRGTDGRAELDLRKSRTSIELFNFEGTTVQTVPGESPVSTYEEFIALAEASRQQQTQKYQKTLNNPEKPASAEAEKSVYPDFSYGHRVQELLDRLAPGGLPR